MTCIMDDSKSDNTDELLSSIDPLIYQSETLINGKDYQKNMWMPELYDVPNVPGSTSIVGDILSGRSNINSHTYSSEAEKLFKTTMPLSPMNLKIHNSIHQDDSLDTNRTVGTSIYEASVSAQTTPRIIRNCNGSMGYNQTDRHSYVKDIPSFYQYSPMDENFGTQLKREVEKSNREIDSRQMKSNESKTEIQRMQLTNKQLSSQLQEAKLSIQKLSIQLEQVQQECKHKEKTLENLDNTLARLVSGWKKRDSQKDQEIDCLSQQISAKDSVINESQRMADESKIALSNTMKTLSMEKMKVDQVHKILNVEIESLKNERIQLVTDNKELAKRIVHIETEAMKLKELCSQKDNNIELLRQQSCGEKAYLEKEIDHFKNEIEKWKKDSLAHQTEIQIRNDKFEQMRHEMKVLEDELHKYRKEMMDKEANLNETKTKIKAMTEDHHTNAKKMEKEFQMRFQRELGTSITALNEQQKKSLLVHSSNFQMKLNEQSKRHRLELERLRQVAEQEIISRLGDSQETIAMLRARLERSEKSVEFWQHEKESVEKARNQISTRLYEIMRLGYPSTEQADNHFHSSAFDQTHHVSIPKPINPIHSRNIFNHANNPLAQTTLPNNYFEPIKLDSKCSAVTAGISLTKSSPYSTLSDAQTSRQNLAFASSINTALSY